MYLQWFEEKSVKKNRKIFRIKVPQNQLIGVCDGFFEKKS